MLAEALRRGFDHLRWKRKTSFSPPQTEIPTTSEDKIPFEDKPEHPLTRTVTQQIEELFSMVAFQRVGKFSSPFTALAYLRPEDLKDAHSLSRVLRLKGQGMQIVKISLTTGSEPYEYIYCKSASIEVEDADKSRVLNSQAILIATAAILGLDWEELSPPTLYFKRSSFEAPRSLKDAKDLLNPGAIKPTTVVKELSVIMGGLKQEFLEAERQSAEKMLTPRQKALVAAIVEKARAIRGASNNRGFFDEFLLTAIPDNNGKLEKLVIIFSAASDRGVSEWEKPDVLGGLTTSWKSHGRQISRTTSSWLVPQPTCNEAPEFYIAEGAVVIQKKRLQSKPDFLETVAVLLEETQREGHFSPRVSDVVSRLFTHYLADRAKNSERATKDIILASSMLTD
ncbi:MAG: hypothetical protein G01um10145_571 [Microgenomates group bacterium Gr01-1014_5]|nr:MAG: hypothetical protein G01um10145_571 [Microgenomates group bacterium Gr01-1014_5]